jgi:hypothetical protein
VADSRQATASALLYGFLGVLLALGVADLGPSGPDGWGLVLSQVLNLGLMAVLIAVVLLVSPQSSWQPPHQGSAR